MPTTWPSILSTLIHRDALSRDEAAWAMGQIMDGEATPAQVAGFAIALRAKGETVDEFLGLVETMLSRASRITVAGPAVDNCGTGGDRSHSVNISTMAALVVAGTGATVVKHGNRAASSTCGSADLLESLGVVIDLPPPQVEQGIAQAGIGFCFAQVFHPGMRHAGPARRELGVPTVFNFLGPLTNPAQPHAQVIGVSDSRMAPLMAQVLADRGSSALVFRGDDGLDELSIATTSKIWRVRGGEVAEDVVDPRELGISAAGPDALRGGDVATNVAAALSVLAGDRGPVRDAVLLNAAAALVALDDTDAPLVPALRAAMDRAADAVDSGAAAKVLELWVQTTQGLRPEG